MAKLPTLEAMLAAVPDALGLGVAAMGFSAAAFRRAGSDPGVRDLVLIAVYLAGVSQGAGHAMVLFLNRVRPVRFALSLALTGAIYLTSALTTAVATVLLANYAFRRDLDLLPTIAVIALAYSPRLIGVLTLAPYLGELLDRVLEVWVLALVIFGLHHGIGVPVEGAALLALLGWGATRLLMIAFGWPLSILVAALRQSAAGGPLTLDAHNLVEALKQQARDAAERRGRRR